MMNSIRSNINDEEPRIQRAPAYDVLAARKYLPVLEEARSTLDSLASRDGITPFGWHFKENVLRPVADEIKKLEAMCAKVSMIMLDLNSLGGIAYNIDQTFCVQSTIKAIAIGAILENNYDALAQNGQLMRDAIACSSDEAYEELYRIYGNQAVKKWASEIGVAPRFVNIMYPRLLTARDLVKFWTRLYAFFNGGQDKENFARYYAASLASATSEILGNEIPVQTKAGWEDRPTHVNDECSCHDSGIVYAPNGPYLFTIFTSIPYDEARDNPLKPLAKQLYILHEEMSEK